MNYKVELYNPDYVDESGMVVDERPAQGSVVVSKVVYDEVGDYYVKLEGAHPRAYPDMAKDTECVGETRSWLSKGPVLFLSEDDPLQIHNVTPTDEPVSQPSLNTRD